MLLQAVSGAIGAAAIDLASAEKKKLPDNNFALLSEAYLINFEPSRKLICHCRM